MSNEFKAIRSLVIAGGGSSGWMAAAYLSRVLFDVNITLIESATTPVIGVGEATVPFIRNYMERVGFLNDRSWMSKCDATFKTGILFENWFDKGDSYWHPFEYLDYIDTYTHVGHCWLSLHKNSYPPFRDRQSFYHSFFLSMTLNVLHRRAPSPDTGCAYHFDAHQFGQLLRCSSPSVKHIIDDIVAVKLNELGEIEALSTREHGDVIADLYIDCTGFRALLINQVARDQKYISYGGSLLCNRAVVLRMPYENELQRREQTLPFVRASASSAGWIWAIPLYSKLSSGYVYSSDFITDHEAELELRHFWGEQRTDTVNAIKIKFRTGKLERHWVKNCLAIGLSGGFIEPLESTGLAMTQIAIEMLASILDARYYDAAMIDRYNMHLEKFYTDIVEFIIPHYSLTRREDTAFWRAVKHETFIPDSLSARLGVFQRHLPSASTKGLSEVWMFRDVSWFSVLLGMHCNFENPAVGANAIAKIRDLLATKRKSLESSMRRLPDHYEYLRDHVHHV